LVELGDFGAYFAWGLALRSWTFWCVWWDKLAHVFGGFFVILLYYFFSGFYFCTDYTHSVYYKIGIRIPNRRLAIKVFGYLKRGEFVVDELKSRNTGDKLVV
jgi:hypothetical protein